MQRNRHRIIIASIWIYRQVNRMLLLLTFNRIGYLTFFPLILHIPHWLRYLIIFKLLLILFFNLIDPFFRLFIQILWWFWYNYWWQLILTFECVGGGIWLIELLRLGILLMGGLLRLVLWRVLLLWRVWMGYVRRLWLVIVLAVVTVTVVGNLTVKNRFNILHLHFSK